MTSILRNMYPTHLPMVPLVEGDVDAVAVVTGATAAGSPAVGAAGPEIVSAGAVVAVFVAVAVGRSTSWIRSTAKVSSRNSSGSIRMGCTR